MRRLMPIVLLLLAGCTTKPTPEPSGRPLPTGKRHQTDRALDLAINGTGYFVVKTPAGGYLFTRHGELVVSASGQIVNADGYTLYPECFVPPGPGVVSVSPQGVIRFTPENADASVIGKIVLTRFSTPAGLERDGEYNLPTEASGIPARGYPATDGFGTIVTGELED